MKQLYENKLEILAEDSAMLDAIAEIFKQRIEAEKPIIEKTDDNRILGEKYRAYEIANQIFKQILADIETYKNKKVDENKLNKGK